MLTRNGNTAGQLFAFTMVAALGFLIVARTSHATIVGAQAYGDDLAGGTITVNFSSIGSFTTNIVAGAPDQGIAVQAGLFVFQVTGDTFLADWTLENQSNDRINGIEFDLTNSNSLFDDGSSPSTPNGFAGRQGAVQTNVGSPNMGVSDEFDLWLDMDNTGDEYLKEFIEYTDFSPGGISVWRDDTDIIGVDTGPELPEPTAASLMLLALGLGSCRRIRG